MCRGGTVIAAVPGPWGKPRGSLPQGELTLPQCLSPPQSVSWAADESSVPAPGCPLISTHSASSQPTMLRVPVLEKAEGTCLALHTLEEQQEMTGPPGSFLFTGMSTSSESKGLFREDECWALGNGAGWPQSLSLPVPRAQLCGPALRGLRAWWLLDPGYSLPHHCSHRLALANPWGCDSPVGT